MAAPRLARLLLWLGLPASLRDEALGDLEELHRTRSPRGRLRAWTRAHLDALLIVTTSASHRTSRLIRGGPSATDIRWAARQLRAHPLTSLTAIVALGVGLATAHVGITTAETMLNSRLPYANGDRFVKIAVPPIGPEVAGRIADVPSLEHFGAVRPNRADVRLAGGLSASAPTAAITPSSFNVLPAVPVAGRLLSSADAAPGAPPVAIVSARMLGPTPADQVVNQTITVEERVYTVVGVVAGDFLFPNQPLVWTPLDERFVAGAGALPENARLFGVRRLGTTLEELQTPLSTIATNVNAPFGGPPLPITAASFTDLGDMAILMSSALVIGVGAVLLLIAANVGNLMLARSVARAQEFAVRTALGASRGALVLLVATEVGLLVLLSALVGVTASSALLRYVAAMDDLPFWITFRTGPWTFVAMLGAAALATLLAGVLPAWRATRKDLVAAMADGGARAGRVAFGRTVGGLVVVQLAVSVALVHGALVVAQAFRAYTTLDVPLPAGIVAVGLLGDTPAAADLERPVAEVPGVTMVGVTSSLPRQSPPVVRVEVEGGSDAAIRAAVAGVSPGFFQTLDARALVGRLISSADMAPSAPAVAVVNERFAREVLGGHALGRRIRDQRGDGVGPWREVVGVVADLGLNVGDPTLSAGFYVPHAAADSGLAYVVARVQGEPLAVGQAIAAAMRRQAFKAETFQPERLEDVAADDRQFFAAFSGALTGLGLITLVLALAGLYAMLSLMVTARTREIGIRLALGASARSVVTTITRRSAWQIGLGGLVGIILARVSLEGRSLLVSRMGDGAWWTLPVVLLLLVLAGLIATWAPVRRVLRIRPQDALRAD